MRRKTGRIWYSIINKLLHLGMRLKHSITWTKLKTW